MKARNRIFITKFLITDDSFGELDFALNDMFDYEDNSEIITIEEKRGSADAEPIDLDFLVREILFAKSYGATHIQIEADWDHNGYSISSYRIGLSTKPEIDAYLNKEKTRKEKELKIEKLMAQVRILESDLNDTY